MSRSLHALPVVLAVAALSILMTSCAPTVTNLAQIRLINAMPDSQSVDIYFNGLKVVSSLSFGGVYPKPATPVAYDSVKSGFIAVEGFASGTTVNPISPVGTIHLNGSTNYTVVAVGLELSEAPPIAIEDNDTVPTAGTLEYRMINASLNSPPTGLDVYVVPPGTNLTKFAPQLNALDYAQSNTVQVPAVSGGYSVLVTINGSKTPIITQLSTAPAGSITTIVILDNSGGTSGISETPLVLNDLN